MGVQGGGRGEGRLAWLEGLGDTAPLSFQPLRPHAHLGSRLQVELPGPCVRGAWGGWGLL